MQTMVVLLLTCASAYGIYCYQASQRTIEHYKINLDELDETELLLKKFDKLRNEHQKEFSKFIQKIPSASVSRSDVENLIVISAKKMGLKKVVLKPMGIQNINNRYDKLKFTFTAMGSSDAIFYKFCKKIENQSKFICNIMEFSLSRDRDSLQIHKFNGTIIIEVFAKKIEHA